MPRVQTVNKARKSPGNCGKCGKEIPTGSGYRHWAFRFGGKHIRCLECPMPRASELTESDKLSRLYAAQEGIEDALGKDDLVAALENAASEAREVAQEYRDSAESILSSFPSSDKADELNDKADNIESWADELENAASDISEAELNEEVDDEAVKAGKTPEEAKWLVDNNGEEFEDEDAWLEELSQKAYEASDSLSI